VTAPANCRYLATHEWHRIDGDLVVIGITDHAVSELTDITYVALPEIGKTFSAGDAFGEVESVKAASEIFTGIAGEVVAINSELIEHPEILNTDAFNAGWMIKIRPNNISDVDKLMDAKASEASLSH